MITTFRFEFQGIGLDSMSILADSVTDAIQSICIIFGESRYKEIEQYIVAIHKEDI